MKNELPTKRLRGRLVCSDNKSVYMQTEKKPLFGEVMSCAGNSYSSTGPKNSVMTDLS